MQMVEFLEFLMKEILLCQCVCVYVRLSVFSATVKVFDV